MASYLPLVSERINKSSFHLLISHAADHARKLEMDTVSCQLVQKQNTPDTEKISLPKYSPKIISTNEALRSVYINTYEKALAVLPLHLKNT